MRYLLSCLILITVHAGQAQITIGPNDMPSAGDTMRYYTSLATGIDLIQNGADQIWDMSTLVPQLPGADTAVTVGSTPLLYQFFFNNTILYPEHAADYAMKGTDIDFQAVSIEDVFDYYKKSATGFRNVGFGANINGLPASVRRIPVDYIHRFPMDFGDQDTSFSAFEVSIPTLGFFGQSQWRYNHVDGWGTLVLPSATFEVLRVRSVLDRRDTLYIDQFNFGFGLDEPQTIEYKWIAQGMDRPVLIVTTVAGVVTAAQFYHDPVLGMEGYSINDGPVLFPNPTEGQLFLRLPNGMTGTLRLYDTMGREIGSGRTVGGHMARVDIAGMAKGTYIGQLLTDRGQWTMRFIVQ